MSKREVLVHACGHIVQPGDTLVVEQPMALDEDRLCTRKGEEAEFVNILSRDGQSPIRYITVRQQGVEYIMLRNVVRFNCTVMEVDDE